MAEFIPTNSLEILLRNLLRDKQTPVWSFFTPLAAAELFIIAKHYPELDGSDAVAPEGENPAVCTFHGGERSWIGVYTSRERARQAMEVCNVPKDQFTCISAQGHGLLTYLNTMDSELWINAGLTECQYHCDPDIIDLLVSRPAPPPPAGPAELLALDPDAEPPAFLAPLHDFLAQQPRVRAAWVFEKGEEGGKLLYDVGLVATDPTDNDILSKVSTVLRAVSPVTVEATAMMMMADDTSLRRLANDQPPFYQAPDFLPAARS
ncbi:MAG: enhanced serine sensitivity protein SseB C-terminal domain-containing protein [Chthoniobacteraceae bacterium]